MPSDEVAGLLSWFLEVRRPMPWRDHLDPYRVWVSEVMLQQTRVETVMPYFRRFMVLFPTVQALAGADLQEVLRCWQGLGYYTRARQLHVAAGMLCREPDRLWPRTAEAWRRLPGIGDYTAAAMASICFGERAPVLDGNVLRVVTRMDRIQNLATSATTRRRVMAWLRERIDLAPHAGDFNQALMELGALKCLPRRPGCTTCPLAGGCAAFRMGDPERFPVKTTRRPIPTRHAVGFRLSRGGRLLLTHRAGERFLGGLWELPGVFLDVRDARAESVCRQHLVEQTGLQCRALRHVGSVRQEYSHFRLELEVFQGTQPTGSLRHGTCRTLRWVPREDLEHYPLTKATLTALEIPVGRSLVPGKSAHGTT